MVSDASTGTAAPKMNKSFVHMAHVSSDRACAQYGFFKRPHLTIINRDMRWDSGWFLGGFDWFSSCVGHMLPKTLLSGTNPMAT
jgi:hypothetical protein